MGDAILEPSDALALTNGTRHFVLMTIIPNGAAFDDGAILEDFVRNPGGGAVAAVGFSRVSFVTSSQDLFEAI